MKRKMIWIGIVMAVGAMAETLPKPPEITDAHKLAYFKRLLAYRESQQAVQAAQQAFQQAVADIAKDCGDQFQPQMTPAGDPACVAKPKPESKPK